MMSRRNLVLGLSAVALVAASSSPGGSRRERLKHLFTTLESTHGGPAYISRERLQSVRREAEKRCAAAARDEDAEEAAYLNACRWAMSQLSDPFASHLPPTEAANVRERFHGAPTLGLTLGMRPQRDESAELAARRGWLAAAARRRRRTPTVISVEEGSPAARAGVDVGDELVSVGGESMSLASLRSAEDLLDDVEEGTGVTLELRTKAPGAANRSVRLRRVRVPAPTVTSRPLRYPPIAGGGGERAVAQLIKVERFCSNTADELRRVRRRPRHPARRPRLTPTPRAAPATPDPPRPTRRNRPAAPCAGATPAARLAAVGHRL